MVNYEGLWRVRVCWKKGGGFGGERGTFVWATSESAGTLPSFFLESWDSAFRRSSWVMWKVDSDIIG